MLCCGMRAATSLSGFREMSTEEDNEQASKNIIEGESQPSQSMVVPSAMLTNSGSTGLDDQLQDLGVDLVDHVVLERKIMAEVTEDCHHTFVTLLSDNIARLIKLLLRETKHWTKSVSRKP